MATQPKKPTTEDQARTVPPQKEETATAQTVPVPPAEDWKGKYLRALADYQNLLRRTAEERAEERKYAARDTVEAMAPAIDLVIVAQKHLNNDGLALALKELDAALSRLGVEPIDPMGKPFDAETMECVEAAQGASDVTQVVSRGYRMHGRVIRPAKVIVGRRQEAQQKKE